MTVEIRMPALSPAMEEGRLARWFVREGDAVEEGDVIAEIETDKATLEFEAVAAGRLGRILVPEGTEAVKVPLAVVMSTSTVGLPRESMISRPTTSVMADMERVAPVAAEVEALRAR